MMDKAATGASGPDLVLSAVVPIDNEADNIGPFLQRLERALDGLDGGYEVGRASRASASAAKRVTASWFYRIDNRLTDVGIPSDTGDFRLLDRRVVEASGRLPERKA